MPIRMRIAIGIALEALTATCDLTGSCSATGRRLLPRGNRVACRDRFSRHWDQDSAEQDPIKSKLTRSTNNSHPEPVSWG